MKTLCLIVLFVCPFTWCAASMPVIDFASIENLIRNYQVLKQQYQVLLSSKETLSKQLTQEKELTQDAEGHYGFGQLFDSDHESQLRQWSPDSWQQALQGMSGGDPSRYQQLLHLYQQQYPVLAKDQFKKGSNEKSARRYQQDVSVNQAANVNASFAFDTIKAHLVSIHNLAKHIDTAPNTKAAIDLNSRLLAEIAYIQAQELKMQALMNQQLGNQGSDELLIRADASRFNQIDQP